MSIEARHLSRRDFLKSAALATATCATCHDLWSAEAIPTPELREARFYDALDDGSIRCKLCPWSCIVRDGGRGRCRVRENRKGRYYSLVYGRPCVMNNDPIEKKPFFHVFPGSRSFSIATVGCNFVCQFCQNWDISQASPGNVPTPFILPEDIARRAANAKTRTVAYTYSEPTIFCEYVIDCAKAAKDRGLGNVVVSNGFIAAKPLKELCEHVTAIKIDLKAFTQAFYEDTCSGQLQPVLDTLKRLKDSRVWFELVMLVIPTLNDDRDDLKRMSEWIVKELGPDVPVHFTRFHPDYKLRNLPPTPVETLALARRIAMNQGCHFAYTGNAPGEEGQNTLCPHCQAIVIDRYGFSAKPVGLVQGKCAKCGNAIPGVWEES